LSTAGLEDEGAFCFLGGMVAVDVVGIKFASGVGLRVIPLRTIDYEIRNRIY
jgi:hypothetical protein